MSNTRLVPGLTLYDLAVIFEDARNSAQPGDELAGDPSRWPTIRGIMAVVLATKKAYNIGNPLADGDIKNDIHDCNGRQ